MKRITRSVSDDLISFTRHLASSVNMQLSLVSILEVMEQEIGNRKFALVIRDITTKIDQGMPLSKALDFHPSEFSDYYRRMIDLGEQSQTLGEILKQLADSLEANYRLDKKIRAALAYPSIVGVLIIINLVLAVNIGLFSRYHLIYDAMGLEIPYFTSIVLSAGETFFYVLGTFFLLIILVIGFYLFTGYYRSGWRKLQLDKLLLYLPLVGVIVRKSAAARFSRTLANLLKGGIPLPDALQLTANSSTNEIIRQSILS